MAYFAIFVWISLLWYFSLSSSRVFSATSHFVYLSDFRVFLIMATLYLWSEVSGMYVCLFSIYIQPINLFSPCVVFWFCLFILLFRVAPVAYGSSQVRGRIGATAVSLHHSRSNTGAEPRLHLHHSSRQCRMPDTLREAKDGTCILMDTSWIRFCCTTTGTPKIKDLMDV